MNLLLLQKFVQEVITSAKLDDEQIENISMILEDKNSLSAVESLNIYRDMFSVRVWDCLIDDYPMTHEILGDDTFSDVCVSYITLYPSRSFTLERLGDNFLEFITKKGSFFSQKKYLVDVVRYEKAVNIAFHSQQEGKIDDILIDPEKVDHWMEKVLCLGSHVSLLKLSYDITELIEFFKSGEPTSRYKVSKKPCFIMIYANCDEIFTRKIDHYCYDFLNCLKNNFHLSLEDVVGQFLDNNQEESLRRIMEGFTTWVNEGIVIEKT